MSFHVIDVVQKSPEWHAARCGILTASAAGDMMAKLQKGEAAARRDLRYRLAIERLTGQTDPKDLSNIPAVQRGNEKEPEARARFEAEELVAVREVGFVQHDELPVGASPDGVIGDFEETVEIKCPKSFTHVQYKLEAPSIPPAYIWQVTLLAWLVSAQWVNFVSYDDRLGPGLDYLHIRVPASMLPTDKLLAAMHPFLLEVDLLYQQLSKMRSR